MSAKSVTGKRPNPSKYSPDKEDVYLQDMERWKVNRMAAKKYFRTFSNLTATNVRTSYIDNNESLNKQPHNYETCQLRCCRVQRPNAGGSAMNKNKIVSVRAHSRSPPNPNIEKQNKGTNNKSVLIQQMEVLKRNRNLLAKRNIRSVSNLSTNHGRPTKVKRLNEGSGSNKSPNYRRNDTANSPSTVQQKCSFSNQMISLGETFHEHLKKVHGPKKPNREIKRPFTDSRGDDLKSLVEEVHESKKSDNEIRRSFTNSRGDNSRSHVEEDTNANASALQQKCPVCNQRISCGETLISHIDKVHGRNKLNSEIKRPRSDGENLKSKVEEAHGSKKPDGKIKKRSDADNLKAHAEEVHENKNPDLEVKRLYNDSRGVVLKSRVEKVRGSEISRSYTEVRGESSKANVEKVHEIKNPASEVKNSTSHVEKVHGMKTSVPLNGKRKSSVHEAKKRVGCDKIPTSEENNQSSEENGETSEVDHDEIPDFENEPEDTNFRGNSKSNIEKVHGSEKPKGPTLMKRLGMKNEPNKASELTLTQLTEIETKGQQLLALVGDLDPNDERRIIFKSRFEDLLRPYKEELKQKTDKTFSMAQ